MRKIFLTLIAVVGLCAVACSSNSKSASSEMKQKSDSTRTAVVYFSATGTTRAAAEEVARAAGARLFEIQPTEAYTDADLDWHDKLSRSSVEMRDSSARPAIKPIDFNPADYDLVFVGYPIWWYVAPRIIETFLDTYDLSGKRVATFATSGGSPIEPCDTALAKEYPAVKFIADVCSTAPRPTVLPPGLIRSKSKTGYSSGTDRSGAAIGRDGHSASIVSWMIRIAG